MKNKIPNFVFLIMLILLQSCSGGKIGNFLESSFSNNDVNKISQKDFNKKSKSDNISKENKLLDKEDKITKKQFHDNDKPQNIVDSYSTKANDTNTLKKRDKKFNPRSYRVFVILKKVDPSSPTEDFSNALRNGEINFEIEKIELMPELNQTKK